MTRNYCLLLVGFFISTIGDWLYQLALPLLVYNITHSAMNMAVIYGLTYVPLLILLPLGGVLTDRLDHRRLLILGDSSSALIVGVLALLLFLYAQSGWIIWLVYPLAFALATVVSIYHPTFQSYLPRLVEDQWLAEANSWMQSAETIVQVVGPLVGGLLIVTLGIQSVLLIDMFSFLLCAFLIGMTHTQVGQKMPLSMTSSLLKSLQEGFLYVWQQPIYRYGSFLFLGTNFAITLIQANFIYYLVNTFHFNPFQIGFIFALTGVGALGGALMAPFLIRHFQSGRILLYNTILSGASTLSLLLAQDVWTISIPWSIAVALGTINVVAWFTLRQKTVPSHLLGRVIALTRWIAYSAIPIASLVGGILLTGTNISIVIGVAAILRICVGVLGLLTPLAKTTTVKLDK